MTITIQGQSEDFDLEDAIAYEFFMNNIEKFFFPDEEETRLGEEICKEVALLAQCSYHLAQIFVDSRKAHKQKTKTNEQDN